MSGYVASGTVERGGEATVSTRASEVVVDGSSGQSDTVPGPADLLTAAFAACVLKNVERFSRMLPFAYERAEIRVEADRQETPPRISSVRYRLTVVTDEPAHRVDLLHRNIRRFGTIYNTLAAVAEVAGDIHTVPVGTPRKDQP